MKKLAICLLIGLISITAAAKQPAEMRVYSYQGSTDRYISIKKQGDGEKVSYQSCQNAGLVPQCAFIGDEKGYTTEQLADRLKVMEERQWYINIAKVVVPATIIVAGIVLGARFNDRILGRNLWVINAFWGGVIGSLGGVGAHSVIVKILENPAMNTLKAAVENNNEDLFINESLSSVETALCDVLMGIE